MKKLLILSLLITSGSSLAQESAFDETQDITVEEEAAAKTYIHQGQAEKNYNEKCSEGSSGFKDICTNDRDGNGSTIERMLPAVSKAYSLVVGMSALSGGGAGAKAGGADGAKGGSSKGSGTDYCKYIPMAGEAFAMASTQMSGDNANQNYQSATPQAKQAASLYAVAKTQKDLGKTSTTQAGIWAAGGGCYAVMMATGQQQMGIATVAKMGGSLLIASFYKKKADAHKKRAAAVEEIANSLPGAGECNPFTNTTCFCNEETSFGSDPGNFQKFCVPKPLVSRNKNNDANICVDDKGQPDPACGCKKEGKCIDKNLKIAALEFGLNPTVMKDPLNGIKPLSDGFGSGNIDGATRANLARIKKSLENYNPESLPSLSKDQQDLAKDFNALGIPRNAAIAMASRSSGGSSLPGSFTAGIGGNAIKGLGEGETEKKPEAINVKFGEGGKVASKSSDQGFKSPFDRFKKKGAQNGAGSVAIEDFAEKARREAEIISDKNKMIFDIISYRYKVSAWREFEPDFTAAEEPEKAKN